MKNMERLSENRLIELGFTNESWTQWWNNSVFVVFYPNDKEMTVYVCTHEDYVLPALGVNTEKDLINLCTLINGGS
jgi:hypothetical protein